jgi:hypothetical protein
MISGTQAVAVAAGKPRARRRSATKLNRRRIAAIISFKDRHESAKRRQEMRSVSGAK